MKTSEVTPALGAIARPLQTRRELFPDAAAEQCEKGNEQEFDNRYPFRDGYATPPEMYTDSQVPWTPSEPMPETKPVTPEPCAKAKGQMWKDVWKPYLDSKAEASFGLETFCFLRGFVCMDCL